MRWMRFVCLIIFASCGHPSSRAVSQGQGSGGSSGGSSQHIAKSLDLFSRDGKVKGLSDYYIRNGYHKVGTPKIVFRRDMTQKYQAGSSYFYDIEQAFEGSVPADRRTVRQVANIADWGISFLFDRYEGTIHPEKFIPVDGESAFPIFRAGWSGEPLASYINHAGIQVDANLHATRTGSGDGDEYSTEGQYFVKSLTCYDDAESPSCTVVFVKDDLTFQFNVNASAEIIE